MQSKSICRRKQDSTNEFVNTKISVVTIFNSTWNQLMRLFNTINTVQFICTPEYRIPSTRYSPEMSVHEFPKIRNGDSI